MCWLRVAHQAVAALLFAGMATHASAVTQTPAPCELKVGWEQWHPYIYSSDGVLQGPEYALLQSLAKRTSCQLVFLNAPWARALILLEARKIDMLYGASHSAEREAYAKFSLPYRSERMVLVTRADETIGNPTDLAAWLHTRDNGRERVIGSIRGYEYGSLLTPILQSTDAPFITVDVIDYSQLTYMLLATRIDAYLAEDLIAHEHLEQHPHALKILEIKDYPSQPIHFMFSRDVPAEVIQRFNTAIDEQTTNNKQQTTNNKQQTVIAPP